jgi:transposase
MFTAELPEGVEATKYDPSCAAMLAMLRYGGGMPFYRLERLQAALDVPLPDATQWEIVAGASDGARCMYGELQRQAAQGEVLHNDDTPMRILELTQERRQIQASGQEPAAKAVTTSGIVAMLPGEPGHKVVLFFTSHAHAGDNLGKVLAQRAAELEAPIQMCDGLSHNTSGEFKTIVSHCLAHARRNFVYLVESFPQECQRVVDVLGKVYDFDAKCREQGLTPEQRLSYHQTHSAQPMAELKVWMEQQLSEKQVEPNSGLGKAIKYMLKRWDTLTLFLRKAGAPLDNNVCERALKQAILHRKNSMLYKTRRGAEVGDIYMSVIHTCGLCGVNPLKYLQALDRHAAEVERQPALWLPWNYHVQLNEAGALAT